MITNSGSVPSMLLPSEKVGDVVHQVTFRINAVFTGAEPGTRLCPLPRRATWHVPGKACFAVILVVTGGTDVFFPGIAVGITTAGPVVVKSIPTVLHKDWREHQSPRPL